MTINQGQQMNPIPFSHHQKRLIDCCLNTIAHIIPVSASVYYLVNEHWQPNNHVLYGIPPRMHQDSSARCLPFEFFPNSFASYFVPKRCPAPVRFNSGCH